MATSTSANPYLVGYEQYLRRPTFERNRAEAQPESVHPVSATLAANRAPAAISRTNAPLPTDTYVQLQPSTNTDGSIDILLVGPSGGVNSQPSLADGLGAAGTSARPQTPTTLNIITRAAGGAVGQMEPASVEITISTQPEEEQYQQQFGSHLQGLTVQQMLDLDIDALVVKIDEHHSQAKKVVLEHFMETKARLIQAKNDALEEERSKGATRVNTKEEELGLVKVELDTMRNKSQRLWDLVGRACTAYSGAKERRRINLVQFQVFCSWREQAMLLARRRRRIARAERWDSNVRLRRNVFRAWFQVAMRAHRVTVNNRYIQEVENAKHLIHEHYQRQIGDMERMLADVHVQLEREAETRSRLEEDMKRAFMRGVCALNIEAMNMMKRGAAPGGANPQSAAAAPPPVGEHQPQESAAGTAGGAGDGLVASSSGQPPAAASAAPARPPGSGASMAGAASTVFSGGSSRPGSSYGMAMAGAATGVGGNQISGRAGAGLQQSAAGAIPGPLTSGGGAEGGFAVRETAQTFYQRPQVVVTRGPGVGLAASNAEAPRPRTNAPLPTVRML